MDVWAGWCTPCLTLKPVIERLAESYRDRVTMLTLDADTNLETVTRFDVRSLPTVLLFADGALVERTTGAQSTGRYQAMLDRHLAARAAGIAPEPVAAATPVSPPPRASISRPSGGLRNAEIRKPKEKAPAVTPRSQPNSARMGGKKSENAVRAFTPTAMVMNTTATTIQP